MPDYTSVLEIGAGSSGDYLTGYMDEIRISNTARYTADFTPTTTAFTSDANTKLLIHSNTTMGSTTFTDSSSGAHTITAVGDIMNVAPKLGTGFGVFNGSNATFETLTAPADLILGTLPFTIDFWAYHVGAWTNNEYFCRDGRWL